MSFIYEGLEFDTRLQAHWVAFFELAGWKWWSNPMAIGDWKPDFKVEFPCDHSECSGFHTLFVSVLPISSVDGFKHHPSVTHTYSVKDADGTRVADAGAAFGSSPTATTWEMSHGAGGGIEEVTTWVPRSAQLWAQAGERLER